VTAAPRPTRAPALIAGCWSLSVVAGAALLAVGPVAPRPEPAELSPYSLAAYLSRVAGTDARDIRVNGVYGSGHGGAWQFTAHLSWFDADGVVRGGTTTLPQLAGSDPLQSDLDDARLQAEQDIGWSLADLDAALDQLSGVSDPLAMLELEILPDGAGDVTSCHSTAPGVAARCRTISRDGELGPAFADELTDSPLADALSVQRARQP
jgi:hypothetical protein